MFLLRRPLLLLVFLLLLVSIDLPHCVLLACCCCWCLVLSCCCCCSGYQLQSAEVGAGRKAVEVATAAAAASSLSWHVDKDQCLAGLRFNIVSVSLALRCWHTLPRFGAWPRASVESGSSSRMLLLELFHHLPRGWWMATGLNINSCVCACVISLDFHFRHYLTRDSFIWRIYNRKCSLSTALSLSLSGIWVARSVASGSALTSACHSATSLITNCCGAKCFSSFWLHSVSLLLLL